MEILIDEDKKKKPAAPKTAAPKTNTRSSSGTIKTAVRKKPSQQDLDEFNDLVSVVERVSVPKKKVVVKRIVKKVAKEKPTQNIPPSDSNPYSFHPDQSTSGVILPDFESEDPNDIDLPLPKSSSNPYSFFHSDSSTNLTTLPSLSSSDEEAPEDWIQPLPRNKQNLKREPNPYSFFAGGTSSEDLELPGPPPFMDLPDVENDFGSDDDDDDFSDSDEVPGPPSILGAADSGWRKRALDAESQSKALMKRLSEAEKTIQKLKDKEKTDNEQMNKILQQVELNLQQSRSRYEERLRKMKTELDNAKLMLQHVSQHGSHDIPENFGEYQQFMVNGKEAAKYSAERLNSLADTAETQLKGLLQGCTALKELSHMLSYIDKFSQPSVQ